MAAFRIPIVAIAYVVERLRQLPGAGILGRYQGHTVIGLLAIAAIAFIVWGLERTPQRFTLAQLAAGELSPMQSWIIVSGDLRTESVQPPRYLYRLTDPAVPGPSMIVEASFELPLGWQTISGQYTGTREGVPAGFSWVGYMEAEPELTEEHQPPWLAIGLFSIALLIVGGSRTTYPMFFRETPGGALRARNGMPIRVHGGWPASTEASPGRLEFSPGGPVQLEAPGEAPLELRLHSAHTAAEAGELRSLSAAEPALLLRRATGELMLSFDSRADRDATFAAMTWDAQRDLPQMGR